MAGGWSTRRLSLVAAWELAGLALGSDLVVSPSSATELTTRLSREEAHLGGLTRQEATASCRPSRPGAACRRDPFCPGSCLDGAISIRVFPPSHGSDEMGPRRRSTGSI